MADEKQLATFDSKAMIAKHAKKGTVIKYANRKAVEIVKETKHYHVGQIIHPHKIMGEELIAQGIAKEAKVK